MSQYSTDDIRNLTTSIEVLLTLAKEITEKDDIRDKLRETAIHLLDEIVLKE